MRGAQTTPRVEGHFPEMRRLPVVPTPCKESVGAKYSGRALGKFRAGRALALKPGMTLLIRQTFRNAVVFVVLAAGALAAAGIAVGQAPAAPAAQPSSTYEKIAITDPDVQAALKVAMADQRQHNRSDMKLLSIVSAERQPVSSRNLRLCLSMDRSGNTELARVVLSRNTKKQWSVAIWSWGSCGR
jgi:hypothetical protein